ncbi:hypothetical protein NWE59_05540 [Mycoplasmopsis felis]|uniref:hypothetical protein n=1 Tax=Mycoplasmopsis felis TaxID=33923 RepID=UPI0021B057E0|nr:hypothetical protein [Mycoplasmopsis felis]UWV78337.1 hypothetical protein NWE59_05540 [Mycoplasmopsis felis]
MVQRLPGSILLQKAFGEQAKNNALTEEQIKIYKLVWSFELYLSPNFIATILTNIVYIIVLNKLYPKFKLVRVEIYSMKHSQEIAIKLRDDKKIVTGITLFNGQMVDLVLNTLKLLHLLLYLDKLID